jgi:hypothetical protein
MTYFSFKHFNLHRVVSGNYKQYIFYYLLMCTMTTSLDSNYVKLSSYNHEVAHRHHVRNF